jgi:pyrimidine operon attenuation protein/uracil phosphoribosyltransferase
LPTSRGERVQVELMEIDEIDRVVLIQEREEGEGHD